MKLTPYCSATLLWCTLVPPGRDCGHLPQKPHGREQVFIEHMAGEISNHGHNMVSELTRTDWCFFSPQRPLNGAVLTLVHYSRCTPLPGCRPSCWCTIMPVPCGLACALCALGLCALCAMCIMHVPCVPCASDPPAAEVCQTTQLSPGEAHQLPILTPPADSKLTYT